MKKRVVVLGAVIVLGVGYVGSSWYIGKKTQGVLEQVVAQNNKEFLNMLGPDLAGTGPVLNIDNYTRGLFSSDVVYSLQFEGTDGEPVVIKFSDHLNHGPFPLNRIEQGNFKPVMAISHAQLMPTPISQKWFDSLGDKGVSPITASTTLGFSGTGHSVWQLKPLTVAKDGNKTTFSGGTINVDLANNYRNKTVIGQFDSLDVADDTGRLTLKGVRLDSTSIWSEPDTTVSHGSAVADSLELDVNDGHPLVVNNGSVTVDSTQKGRFLDGALLYKLGDIKVGGADLGSLEAGGKVAHVDMAALADLNAEYARQAAQADKDDTEETAHQNDKALHDKIQAVLASNPVVSIDPFKWTLDKNESTLFVKVQLSSPQDSDHAGYVQLLLEKALKDVVADISLSRPMMVQLITQSMIIDGQTPPSGFVEHQVDGYAGRMVNAGLAKADGDSLVSTLHFHDDVVDVNGTTMSLSELAQRAFGVALGR